MKYKFVVFSVTFSLWAGIVYSFPAIIEKNISPTISICEYELPSGGEMQFDQPLNTSSTTIPGQKIIVTLSGPIIADSGFRSISTSVLQKIAYSRKYSSFCTHHDTLRSKIFHFSPLINQLQI